MERHYPNEKSNLVSLIGHIMRMDSNTPAAIAFQEIDRKRGKKKQGNNLTWKKLIDSDIKEMNEKLQIKNGNLNEQTEDRKKWRGLVHGAFSGAKS